MSTSKLKAALSIKMRFRQANPCAEALISFWFYLDIKPLQRYRHDHPPRHQHPEGKMGLPMRFGENGENGE